MRRSWNGLVSTGPADGGSWSEFSPQESRVHPKGRRIQQCFSTGFPDLQDLRDKNPANHVNPV